jgi:hypothetical protein
VEGLTRDAIMIGLLMMATTTVATCPGGPLFAFRPGTASFTKDTDHAIPQYLDNLNSELWRSGWISISPTVLNTADRASTRLVMRREKAIWTRMARLGIGRTRIRFEAVNATYGNDPHISEWIDVYPSTLNVSRNVWNRRVDPRMMC